jgi:hypothetical protein
MGLRWGEFSCELVERTSPDILLAADCFYDPADFENILATVYFFALRKANFETYILYQERSTQRSIEQLLAKWNLHAEQLVLGAWFPDATVGGCRESFQLIRIVQGQD